MPICFGAFYLTFSRVSNGHFHVRVSVFNIFLIVIIINVNCNALVRNSNILMFINRKLKGLSFTQDKCVNILGLTHERSGY